MTVLTTVLCWLNASKAENNHTLRLNPVEGSPILPKDSVVWVNLPTKGQALRLANRIRETYETHSYQILLDLSGTNVTQKNGSFAVRFGSFAELKKAVIVLEKSTEAEAVVDPDEEDFFASLPSPTTTSAVASDDLPF